MVSPETSLELEEEAEEEDSTEAAPVADVLGSAELVREVRFAAAAYEPSTTLPSRPLRSAKAYPLEPRELPDREEDSEEDDSEEDSELEYDPVEELDDPVADPPDEPDDELLSEPELSLSSEVSSESSSEV